MKNICLNGLNNITPSGLWMLMKSCYNHIIPSGLISHLHRLMVTELNFHNLIITSGFISHLHHLMVTELNFHNLIITSGLE